MTEQSKPSIDFPLVDDAIAPFIRAHQAPTMKDQQSLLEMLEYWIEVRTMHERIKHNSEPLITKSLARVGEKIEINGEKKDGYMLTVAMRPDADPTNPVFWGSMSAFLEENSQGRLVALHTRHDVKGN